MEHVLFPRDLIELQVVWQRTYWALAVPRPVHTTALCRRLQALSGQLPFHSYWSAPGCADSPGGAAPPGPRFGRADVNRRPVVATHLVRLQFVAGGPAVTGESVDDATAHRTWRDWVGLYGSNEQVVIRLAEESGGRERVLLTWERGRVVEAGSDCGHRSGS